LEDFKKTMDGSRVKKQPRLVLIIMANTHDKTLNKGCVKDAKAVKKVFADICKHIHFDLCPIEISGSHYHRDNLFAAIDSIMLHSEDDVTLFYYSGHGFSYQKDKGRKYPQVDLRAHNDQVRYNDISFIEKHTENLAAVLSILRFKGARINIAIGDCCNTSIPFKRPADSEEDMAIVKHITPHPSKTLNQKIFNDPKNSVSILVSSSQYGQPALTDLAIGSIFTHHFTKTLSAIIANHAKGNGYLPWLKLLRQTSRQAFKDSKGYDIGGGKPGKQKAVFEVFIDRE
jgi:hypothetical protein